MNLGNFGQGVLLIVLGVALGLVGQYFKIDYSSTAGLLVGYGVRHLSGDNGNNAPAPPAGH